MENQSKEADMPQIAGQDTEEQVEAEVGDVEATEEETTDLKALEKKKVTMIIMIKKNQRLMKDQEDVSYLNYNILFLSVWRLLSFKTDSYRTFLHLLHL